jgi:hypothetical protein
MAFKYTYTDPNQVIKATFPFAGKIDYIISGGGGGGGGPDVREGGPGGKGSFIQGSFKVPANAVLVMQAGGGGAGGSGGAGANGGLGGQGLFKGGRGGGGSYGGGSSGGGGGGGAASFIMTLSAYNKFVNNDIANLEIPLIVAAGGGAGGGDGWHEGAKSVPGGGQIYRVGLNSIETFYGQNGYDNGGDGGGGGGGGGGYIGLQRGGGAGGDAGAGDVGGYGGSAGATGINYTNPVFSPKVTSSNIRPEGVTAGLGGGPRAAGTNGIVSIEYTPDNQDEYDIYSKMDGAFKKATGVYVRANSGTTWQQVKEAYVKQSGSWVRVLRVIDPNTYAPILQNISSTIKGPLNKGADLGWVTVTGAPEWTGNTTMNSYAIANESVNKLGSHEFTTTVFIPEAGNYRIIAASDNVGYVTANCNRCSTVDSFQTAPGYKSFLVNLPRGEIYLTIEYENTGGSGGIAAIIQKLDGTQMWNTRAWQNGTYSFTYNVIDAGIIGSDVCVSLTEVTPEA